MVGAVRVLRTLRTYVVEFACQTRANSVRSHVTCGLGAYAVAHSTDNSTLQHSTQQIVCQQNAARGIYSVLTWDEVHFTMTI